jgi:hypothetical protein
MGFPRVQEGARREGWLVNMRPVRPYLSLDLIRNLMFCRR